ncbi:MAG: hypothetical protein ACYDH0_05290 [Candidatus Aminicenantales bacterium]
MKNRNARKAAVLFLGGLLAASLAAGPYPLSSASDPSLDSLLDAAAGKMDSYPDLDRWEAVTVTTRSRMDKSWEPEKITRIKKSVHVEGQDRRESVLEAVEIEKGVIRDITERMARTYEERARKEREERASGKISKAGDDRRAITLTKRDFLPFAPGERSGYEFRRLEDAIVEGIPACVIETRAKIRKPENTEGKYYFALDTMDILKVDLQPSRNPAFVKEIEMEVEFIPSQGAPAMKRTRLKVHAGFLFKTVRLIIEEEYADFRFLPAIL